MGFDIEGARKAGYSDDQIADYLAGQKGIDVAAARKAGYTTDRLMVELSDAFVDRTPSPEQPKQAAPSAGLSSVRRGGTRGEAKPFVAADPLVSADPLSKPAPAEQRQPLIEQRGAPVSDEVFKATVAQLSAMPRAQRQAQAKRTDLPGWMQETVRRAVEQIDGADAGAQRVGMTGPSLEARTARLMRDGADQATSTARATTDAQRGAETTGLPQMTAGQGLLTGEEQTANKAEGLKVSGKSFAERGLYGAKEGLVQGTAGLIAMGLRAAGDEEAAKLYEKVGQGAAVRAQAANELALMQEKARDAGILPSGPLSGAADYMDRMGTGAANSIGQMIPGIAAGLATGNTGVGLAMMALPVFGQSYIDKRDAGGSPGMSAAYGGAMAALEIIGERYGMLPAAMNAFRKEVAKKPLEEVPAFIERGIKAMEKRGLFSKPVAAIARGQAGEQFGEQITGAGQYLLDGTAFGLDKPISLMGFIENARDTAVQTLLATGVMQAGGAAAKRAMRGTQVAEDPNATDRPASAPMAQPIPQRVEPTMDGAAQSSSPAQVENNASAPMALSTGAPAEAPAAAQNTAQPEAQPAAQAVDNITGILQQAGALPQDFTGLDEAPRADAPTPEPAPVEGEKINRNWSAFAPESGTLGIPRADMPQVSAEHRGALVQFLGARGIEHTTEEVPADSLKPTQAEYSPRKVAQARERKGGDRSILVSSDGYVIDGHHQWLAARESGYPVKAIVMNAPAADVLRLFHQFPSSTVASGPSKRAGATVAQAGANVGELDAADSERIGDSGRVDAKQFAELAVSPSFSKEGLRSFDVPTERAMLARMSAMLQQPEVRRRVVDLVPINVVHVLIGEQGTADQLFNNPSVLADLAAIDRNDPVPVRSHAIGTAVGIVARAAAEQSRLSAGLGGPSAKPDAASNTGHGDLISDASGTAVDSASRPDVSRVASKSQIASGASKVDVGNAGSPSIAGEQNPTPSGKVGGGKTVHLSQDGEKSKRTATQEPTDGQRTDAGGTAQSGPADGAAGTGTDGVVQGELQQPAAAGTSGGTGDGPVASGGAAPTGPGRGNNALKPGATVTLDGKAWTVDQVKTTAVGLKDAEGKTRMVARNGATFQKIKAALQPTEHATEGPGSNAGNGFKQGPKKGERYRVGIVAAAGGAVSLEKRLPAGTAATFYVGKDGNLIDGDSVNFIGAGRESLWIPATAEQSQQAQSILDEMGRLDLNDPARKDAKARLKALVLQEKKAALQPAATATEPATAETNPVSQGAQSDEVIQPSNEAGVQTAGLASPATTTDSAREQAKPQVYKTKDAASKAAKEAGNTLKVQKVKDGFILRQKTAKEIDAEAKAAQRLARGKAVDTESDTLLTAIAKLGGLDMSERADTIGSGNKNIGGKMLYRNGGQSIDTLANEALHELGYIPPEEHARDGGVRWLRDAIAAEFMGTRTHHSQRGQSWMEQAQEDAARRYEEPDPLADFSVDDLNAEGYTGASTDVQAITESLLADAQAQGIDTEAIGERVAMATEGATEDEYHQAFQAAIREAVAENRGTVEERDTGTARAGSEDRSGLDGTQGSDQEGLTLEAQTDEDLNAKTDREAAALRAEKAKKDSEQARLKKEAEARDDKARADQTVNDFQLGQSAEQQMSGMGDLFAEPGAVPATVEADNNQATKLSRSGRAGRGISITDAEAIAADIRATMPTAPQIVVVESVGQLPDKLRNLIEQAGADNDVEGVYWGGKVYAVTAHFSDLDRFRFVVAHHELRHHGFGAMLGPRLHRLMMQIYRSNAKVRELADKNIRDGIAKDVVVATEEALADMPVEDLVKLNFWASLKAAVREFLRNLAMKLEKKHPKLADMLRPEGWTDEDIARLISRAEDMSRTGEPDYVRGGAVFAQAWHGTPHRGIEKFSTDKIGTGEGAQAYGWGLYFASKREIAEYYRKTLSGDGFGVVRIDGHQQIADPEYGDMMVLEVDERPPSTLTGAEGYAFMRKYLGEFSDARAELALSWLDVAERQGKSIEVPGRDQKGQLYKVDIPEDSEMLLWDKPLSEQPEAVRKALEDLGELVKRKDGEWRNLTGWRLYEDILAGAPENEGLTHSQAQRIASETLAAIGIKGIKYLDGTSRDGSGNSHNYVIFSGDDVQIERAMFSRARPKHDQATTGAMAEDQAQEAPAAQPGQAPAANRWTDDLGRLRFTPGQAAFDMLGRAASPLLVKLGMKAASPELKRQLRAMRLEVQKAQDVALAVAQQANELSPEERAMVSDIIEKEMVSETVPPEHAVRLAAVMNQAMATQTKELVRLGMLSQEVADRWNGKYLPRFYESKLGDKAKDAWNEAIRALRGKPKAMQGIKAKHLKGRGLYETIPADSLAEYEALGWQVRDDGYVPGETPVVQVWRDYTREERDGMGEIRDAAFRFVTGYMQTQRDIALGRMFEAMATDETLSSRTVRDGWVKVPDTSVEGTNAKRYGKLAGRYVAPEVLSHLSSVEEAQSDALQLYRKAMAWWKQGKTALNPVSHANNIISNLTMAHFAGVSYWDAHKYVGALQDFITKAPGIQEARDAGLFLSTMSDAELAEALPPDLRALAMKADSATKRNAKLVVEGLTSWFLTRPMGAAYNAEDLFFRYLIWRDARGQGMAPDAAVEYAQKFIFAYDDLPRGARMVRDFAVPFFAYTFKAVPALLHTAMVYPWRMAAPAAVLWAANAAAYAIFAGGDDDDSWWSAIQKYLNDPEHRKRVKEAEKLERENLPQWMKGSTALLTPKAIRLGVDEVTSLPLFIDVSRLVPGGDLFDVTPNAGGLPIPQPLTPSHPLFTIATAMIANRDLWTGKDLVDSNDTKGEATAKRLDWAWKQVSPAIAVGNYHWERLMQALAHANGGPVQWLPDAVSENYTGVGRDGLPVQPKYAIPQTFGVKVRPLDLEHSEAMANSLRLKMIGDIEKEMRRLDRLLGSGAISQPVYERETERAGQKIERVGAGLTVDGEEPN